MKQFPFFLFVHAYDEHVAKPVAADLAAERQTIAAEHKAHDIRVWGEPTCSCMYCRRA